MMLFDELMISLFLGVLVSVQVVLSGLNSAFEKSLEIEHHESGAS